MKEINYPSQKQHTEFYGKNHRMDQVGLGWLGRDLNGYSYGPKHVREVEHAFMLDISAIVIYGIWKSCVMLSPC